MLRPTLFPPLHPNTVEVRYGKIPLAAAGRASPGQGQNTVMAVPVFPGTSWLSFSSHRNTGFSMRALAWYRHALKADWVTPADVKKVFRRANVLKDLEPRIGKSNRVYEVLNHKHSLTLKNDLAPA